jgi:hypothetical protein
MNLINDDELKKKCAFNLWRHNAKAMELDENSRIIQNFVGKILDKIKNKRNRTNLKNISKGLDILSNLKGPLRDGFNAIRSEANRKTFTKFVNDLDNKRKDHLKTAYDAIRDAEKDKLLNKLFNIPESARLRILKKWFDIWKDKADKLGRNWAARTIQRAWRNYIIRRRFDKLNDRIIASYRSFYFVIPIFTFNNLVRFTNYFCSLLIFDYQTFCNFRVTNHDIWYKILDVFQHSYKFFFIFNVIFKGSPLTRC